MPVIVEILPNFLKRYKYGTCDWKDSERLLPKDAECSASRNSVLSKVEVERARDGRNR